MKKIFTLIASLMMVLSMNAATKTIYCKMAQSWWKADGAAVGAHYWGTGGDGTSWPGNRMTPVTGETDLWSVDIDTDKYQNIIFTRVNGSGTVSNWGAKTADLTIPTDDKNLYTITSTSAVWGNPGVAGNWSIYTPTTEPAEPVKYTWTVAGTPASVFGVEWAPDHDANDMVEQADGTYKWEKENIEFADNNSPVKFKVCQDHAWAVAYPAQDYSLNIPSAGVYTITITFNAANYAVNATATKTAEYEGEAPTHTYSVVGSNADLFGTAWDAAVEENLMQTTDNIVYTWKKEGVTLRANFEMKVVQDKAFSVAYPDQNKVVEVAKEAIYTVTITFNVDTKDIVVALDETGEATPVVVTYELKGVGGWDQPGIELVQNPDKASEYMLTCQAISATDAIKVVRLEDGVIKDYYGNGTVKDGVEVTVDYDGDGNIKLTEGKYNFYFDTAEPEKKLWIAECPNIDVTLSGMVATPVSRMGRYSYLSLDDEDGNQISIFNGTEGAYGDFEVSGYLAEYDVTVVGNGTWEVVDGVETLTATLQAEENATAIYNVTATVAIATTITLECGDATYTITDPEYNEVTFTGVADGKEFSILVSYFDGEYYSEGEWGETFIMGTEIEFDDSDAAEYYLGGTYIDDAGNTYEVVIFGAPAAEEPEVPTDPEPAENVVYFVNTASWTTVNVYAWDPENNAAWPGITLTSTDIVEQIGGYDVYKYAPDATYANVIFNNGNGTQTPDLVWQNGKYYVYNGNDNVTDDDWYDKSEVEDALPTPISLTYTVKVPAGTPECYITGENTGGFGTFVKMNPAAEADVFTVDIAWATESQKYKYSASASWDYEEVNEDGSSVTDRTWQARDEVKKWKTDPTATVTPVDAYTVTVPAGTKECYIRGGFDNWADFHKMTKVDDTHYTISITGATSIHEYKYASGPDWKYAEVKEDGSDPGNRKWDDEEDIVVKWATLYDPETATDYSNQPATIYFRPSTSWKTDNARFEVWFFEGKDGAQDKFVTMKDTDNDGVYEVANDKNYAKVIFVRMNPDAAENNWDSKWNQTGDIEIPNVANNLNTCYAFWTNNIDNTAGTWVVPETIGSGDNTAFYNKYAGKTINVVVDRTFTKNVKHTICLPFTLPANWIGTAYQLSGVKSNSTDELVVYVNSCNTLEAGKPYLLEPTNDELESKEYLLVDNVTISTTTTDNNVSNSTHIVTLKGLLNGGGLTDGSKEYYIGTDGKLHKDPTNKLALRAIIEITDKSGNPVNIRARVAFDENAATGFENIVAPEGQTIKAIVNGQLVIIRGGEMYNVQGQKL